MIHPLNSVVSGPGVYEDTFEMSPTVCLNSFRGAMSPLDLLFNDQDGVLGSGVRHKWLFPPLSVLALLGLQQCDVIHLPGLLTFLIQPSAPLPQRLYPLGLLDSSTFHSHG